MSAVETVTADSSLPRRLGRAGRRLRPRAASFWAWWTQALASWLPLRVRKLFGLAHERLLLQPAGDSLRLVLEREAEARELGQVPWSGDDMLDPDPLQRLLAPRVADLPRWLVLPAGSGLRRSMVLPAAAEPRLRDMLGFEIERQTPFTAADVQYDARVTGRRDDGQLDVELVVVPSAALDTALGGLGPVSRTLTGADLQSSDGRTLGVNLLPGARRHQRTDPWLGWNLALASVAVIALAASLWQMLSNRSQAADAFEAEVSALATRARTVSVEKQRLLGLVEGMRFLQATRAGRPTTVEVLDEFSRRLPDSTHLEKLSIEDDRILLIGLSRDASSLVRVLEGSDLWRSPALTGALQPDPRTGSDRFTLTAELVVTPPPATAANRGDADAENRP
ncbi:PilN domain-containing protein [Luteimonas vadosa]|uniref:PilN domain-containing protein n=1 Tax=Luteimonas vadosa TaxID=1165507 RepID=A0ABP9DRR0_9GAMM